MIRYVVTRRALPGALGLDEGDLPAADGRPAYRIRAYMTNFPAPDAIRAEKANGLRVLDAAEVVAAAHERCGRGEEVHAVHAVLKSDLAAGTMPSGRFGANAAWLWLAALALKAMALVRRAAYGPEWRWVRMKRIRAIWIHLVARVARHGRRVTLVLGGAGAHLLAARRRIHLAMPPPASRARLTPARQFHATRRTRHGTGGRCARPNAPVKTQPSRRGRRPRSVAASSSRRQPKSTTRHDRTALPMAEITPPENQLADQGEEVKLDSQLAGGVLDRRAFGRDVRLRPQRGQQPEYC